MAAWVTPSTSASAVRVVTTTDGGASWATTLTTPTIDGPQFALIGFEDGKTGRAVYGFDRLWTTRDGGTSWQPTTLPSSDGSS